MAVDVATSDAELARTHGLKTAEEIAEFRRKIDKVESFLQGGPSDDPPPAYKSPTLARYEAEEEKRREAGQRRRAEQKRIERERLDAAAEERMARMQRPTGIEVAQRLTAPETTEPERRRLVEERGNGWTRYSLEGA